MGKKTEATEQIDSTESITVELPEIIDSATAIKHMFAHRDSLPGKTKNFNSKGFAAHGGLLKSKNIGLLNMACVSIGLLAERAADGDEDAQENLRLIQSVSSEIPEQFESVAKIQSLRVACGMTNASRETPMTFGEYLDSNIENSGQYIKDNNITDVDEVIVASG